MGKQMAQEKLIQRAITKARQSSKLTPQVLFILEKYDDDALVARLATCITITKNPDRPTH